MENNEQCKKCLKSFNTTYCNKNQQEMKQNKNFKCPYFVLDDYKNKVEK